MDISTVWQNLCCQDGGKIVAIILDGVGELPSPKSSRTELQATAI
jgi:2,3-bisphosphoglycerate-independent phosphoglycerate mutase